MIFQKNFKMKKNKFTLKIIMFSFTALFTLLSCNKSSDFDSNLKEILLRKELTNFDFKKIGSMHNDGLNFVLKDLRTKKNKKSLSKGDIDYVELIFDDTENYLRSNTDFTYISENIYTELSDSKYLLLQNQENVDYQIINNLKNEISVLLISSFGHENFININNLLERFETEEAYTLSDLQIDLNQIDYNIMNQLTIPLEDLVLLRSLIATLNASLSYWSQNLYEWQDLNNNNNFKQKSRDWGWFRATIKKMGVADAYGAGVGAVVGFVSSLASGPGVVIGTLAGAVGYGMNASALQGVRELLQ